MRVWRLLGLVAIVVGVVALAFAGHAEFAPMLLVAAFPVAGRFPGEALIVARRALHVARRPFRARWAPTRATVLAVLLERTPRTLRGPPVAA
jgi:hypothetical protein